MYHYSNNLFKFKDGIRYRVTRPAAGYYHLLDTVSTGDFYEDEESVEGTLDVSNLSTLPEGVNKEN